MPDNTLISNLVIRLHHLARGKTRDTSSLDLQANATQMVSCIILSSGEVMEGHLSRNDDSDCKDL
jgi:hypothetical protein